MTSATAPPRGRRTAATGDGDRPLYLLAAVLLGSGLAHLGVQLVQGGPWEGPVSWRKPVTFGLSFGIVLATTVWATSLLPSCPPRSPGSASPPR